MRLRNQLRIGPVRTLARHGRADDQMLRGEARVRVRADAQLPRLLRGSGRGGDEGRGVCWCSCCIGQEWCRLSSRRPGVKKAKGASERAGAGEEMHVDDGSGLEEHRVRRASRSRPASGSLQNRRAAHYRSSKPLILLEGFIHLGWSKRCLFSHCTLNKACTPRPGQMCYSTFDQRYASRPGRILLSLP